MPQTASFMPQTVSVMPQTVSFNAKRPPLCQKRIIDTNKLLTIKKKRIILFKIYYIKWHAKFLNIFGVPEMDDIFFNFLA